jgi:hypothetical protein
MRLKETLREWIDEGATHRWVAGWIAKLLIEASPAAVAAAIFALPAAYLIPQSSRFRDVVYQLTPLTADGDAVLAIGLLVLIWLGLFRWFLKTVLCEYV